VVDTRFGVQAIIEVSTSMPNARSLGAQRADNRGADGATDPDNARAGDAET
jgi:hypothetical protein